jgi:hypothetical protein
MLNRSIDQFFVQKQVVSVVDYNKYTGVVYFSDNTILCPLCDHRHDNNTNCQRMG